MEIIKMDTKLETVFKTQMFQFVDAGSIRKITGSTKTYISLFE